MAKPRNIAGNAEEEEAAEEEVEEEAEEEERKKKKKKKDCPVYSYRQRHIVIHTGQSCGFFQKYKWRHHWALTQQKIARKL